MRQLKFRTWRSKLGMIYFRFRDVTEISEGDYAYVKSKDGMLTCIDCDDQEDHVVMQFTGFKDKNGKEIFEGDIVRTVHGDHEVKFGVYNDNEGYVIFDHCGWYIAKYYPLPDVAKECGIVGNIYQNPDLLTTQH